MSAATAVAAPRQVILSADDFGLSPGVNAGVARAHRDGVLTDAGLMVNSAAFDAAVEIARATPSLSVGLHLVLLQGYATLAARQLGGLVAGDGRFADNPVIAGLRYFAAPGLRAHIEREVRAQLEKFLRTGLRLSHVDGHLNIHMHPTVLNIVLRLAPEYGIRALRLTREPLRLSLRLDRRERRRKLVEAATFAALVRYAAPRLARAGIRVPRHVFGLHQSGHVTEPYLLGVLAALPPGVTEIYCHAAAAVDAEARRWRPADYESEAELAAMVSPRTRAALADGRIELISYRTLASSASTAAADKTSGPGR